MDDLDQVGPADPAMHLARCEYPGCTEVAVCAVQLRPIRYGIRLSTCLCLEHLPQRLELAGRRFLVANRLLPPELLDDDELDLQAVLGEHLSA